MQNISYNALVVQEIGSDAYSREVHSRSIRDLPDGDLLIEGQGILLDIVVPVTFESALGLEDPVLEAAIDYLLDIIE